ncbi:MAG: hypothetical protein JRJ37_03095 [Deltaproteobacteria bacterium]|nr:hypothetical protein [Deltaproteobacteria bacterium]
MLKRKRCQNKDCARLFVPCPQVPKQKFCSRKECQQARKREWNKKKLASDPEYQEARKDAQKRWKDKNPNYWKDYRARHSGYTRKNREQQNIRNRKRRQNPPAPKIAGKRACETPKTDESIPINNVLTGRYKIVPVRADMIVKTDECIVEITAISSG